MVNREAIAWIQTGVQTRGTNTSVLWIDEPPVHNAWRFPPVVKVGMLGYDILINQSFNLLTKEFAEFREYIAVYKIKMVRNFANTAPLLCTTWAQTPYELVSEIRYQASLPFQPGKNGR